MPEPGMGRVEKFLRRRVLPTSGEGESGPTVDRATEIRQKLAEFKTQIQSGERALDDATRRQIGDWQRELAELEKGEEAAA